MIRTLRKRKGLSQSELAAMVGLKYQSVQKWETGKGHPTTIQLGTVSKALGVSVSDLLEGRMPEEEVTEQTNKLDSTPEANKSSVIPNERLQYELRIKELELEMERRVNAVQSELLKYKEREIQQQQQEIERQRSLSPDQDAINK